MPRIIIPAIKLHSGQEPILSSRARFRVISAGRRFGKTLLATEWLTLAPGGAVEGKPVAFFSPSYKLLLDVWDKMERTLKPIIKKANKTEMRIDLITRGSIDFWTLEDKDAGRGRKYARVVLDEAAHARYLKDAWEKAIAPTLSDYKGEAWFISTPNGINFFHELFQRGMDLDKPDWESFHMPTKVNPHISDDEIERARSDLPSLVFAQEYLAEFVTFGAGLVKPDMLQSGTAPRGLPIALGVDLAISTKQGADWTAIAAMSRGEDGTVYLREVTRLRGEFRAVLEAIKQAATRWSPSIIGIEQVQYQAAVVQELSRSTNLPVRGIRPDKDKLTRFTPLLTRYERREVIHDPSGVPGWFSEELVAFPQGPHDDGVDAVSLAWRCLDESVSPAKAARAPAKQWGAL